ncbi:hypothetical protein FN846DRAFT_969655 [Sphaerosporella brunnea]|uniref:Uncharacterized protein n=1 Tax=Sphaerosporella brunnea TaxID=1250544 RepID=A0A5J5EK91_9PEZI|nr:hypothetical protein FN846DRAFT_969655 [Sphaerosporella brunnea]
MSTLPVVADGDYTYTPAGLVIKGHIREEPRRLHELLFPPFLSTIAEVEAHRSGNQAWIAQVQKERQERERWINRKWAVSQLMHYGVPLVAGEDKIQALREAVKGGKCNQVPGSVNKITHRLRREYQRRLESQPSPSDQANTDIDAFLDRVFLDVNGEIDPRKAPQGLPLPGLEDRFAVRNAAVEAGLYTRSGGRLVDGRVLVIGTDKNLVDSIARGYAGAVSELQMQLEDRKDEVVREHEVFLSSGEVEAKGEPHYVPTGTYRVFLPVMESEAPYKCLEEGLTLCIQNDLERRCANRGTDQGPAFMGDFSFAGLNGIMRFCRDGDDWSDFQCLEDDYAGDGSSRKRKYASDRQVTPERTPAADPDPTIFHFLWRGMETGNTRIEQDLYNQYTGWIQFVDEDFTKFRGIINGANSIIGHRAKIEGFKVSEETERTHKRWRDYSQEQ